MTPPYVASAPWRDISGLHRQRHQKGRRSRLPVRAVRPPPNKNSASSATQHNSYTCTLVCLSLAVPNPEYPVSFFVSGIRKIQNPNPE
jgi:hypothetical protein